MLRGILAGPRKGLDRGVHRSWSDSWRSAGVAAGPLLAWANTDDAQFCIGAAGVLSISSGEQDRRAWLHVGWHLIERGGFDADTSTLSWTLYAEDVDSPGSDADATTGSVALPQPGRLPLIFRDRVNASIAVEQFVRLHDAEPAPGRQHLQPGVIISGRRDLGSRNPSIHWRASLPRGISWQTPGISELAAESVSRLRAEYDPSG